jgi:hypothetical protein
MDGSPLTKSDDHVTSAKRGAKVGKTKREKGTKWMVVDGQSRPVGNFLAPVSSVEVALEAGDRRGKRCFATRKR